MPMILLVEWHGLDHVLSSWCTFVISSENDLTGREGGGREDVCRRAALFSALMGRSTSSTPLYRYFFQLFALAYRSEASEARHRYFDETGWF
mmetsp:Transcript_39526/g.81160  ORF Transcript_39526/g.81160 Transcript_39526/m.81160 type:complete len:92 (-) Transcript_39526:35-310(-)